MLIIIGIHYIKWISNNIIMTVNLKMDLIIKIRSNFYTKRFLADATINRVYYH